MVALLTDPRCKDLVTLALLCNCSLTLDTNNCWPKKERRNIKCLLEWPYSLLFIPSPSINWPGQYWWQWHPSPHRPRLWLIAAISRGLSISFQMQPVPVDKEQPLWSPPDWPQNGFTSLKCLLCAETSLDNVIWEDPWPRGGLIYSLVENARQFSGYKQLRHLSKGWVVVDRQQHRRGYWTDLWPL